MGSNEKMGILIVDDSRIERMILKELLESEGHVVDVAQNGAEALNIAFVSLPELIISDILMPVMDGFSLCKSIRSDKQVAHIPFVFYTATYTKEEDEHLGLKIGADGFFRKSMEWEDFYAAIMALVKDIGKIGRSSDVLPEQEEADLYKLYNERLIKKLEDTVFELEKEVRFRQEVEAQLRESQQRLDLAIEGADIGLWGWDVITGEAHFTRNWVQNFGYKPEEIIPRFDSWVNLIHPDDRKKTLNAVEANLSGQALVMENEHRIKDASGQWRWLLSRGKVVERDTQGNPLRQAGTFIEITKRKQTEEALKQSRKESRELSQHLQSVIENERMKIARDIHDELGQVLTAIKFDVSRLKDQMPKDRKPLIRQAESAISLIDHVIGSVKRIVSDLRPTLLDDIGLVAAIEWQAETFEKRTGVKHQVEIHPENIYLDNNLSTAIFRVCQEAMTNAARHAKASHVLIKGGLENGILDLLIKDNGTGIDEHQLSDPRSFGLMGMRERIAAFGGRFQISKDVNGGTRLEMKIPVN